MAGVMRDAALEIAELRRHLAEVEAQRAAALIENARLQAALQGRATEQITHQAAIIDVLKAMSASSDDAQPVLDLIIRRAREVCGSTVSVLLEFDREQLHLRSWTGCDPDAAAGFLAQFPMVPDRGTAVGRAAL